MRIAISTDGDYVSQHFGRCPSFTLVDVENGKLVKKEVVQNPGHTPGNIPQFLHGKGAVAVVCGGMGGRAQGFFDEFGIKTIIGVEGTIEEVIKKLENNSLQGGGSLCTPGAGKGYGIDKTECDHAHE